MTETLNNTNLSIFQKSLFFYIDLGIISLSDVVSLTEDTLMNKILKQVHPYNIFFFRKW